MPKAGAYYLYMLDFKQKQEEQCGRSLSMAEVSKMASDSWKAMPEDERACYKQKAKGGEVKVPRRNNANAKTNNYHCSSLLTAQRVPVSVYEQEAREKEMKVKNMRRRIDNMIQEVPLMTDFLTYPLYLMYGNYFYKNGDGKYRPAEIALVKFTFRDGVLDHHNVHLKPGTIESGFALAAKTHSERTHRLPWLTNTFGESDYRRVFFDIKNWLEKDATPTFDGGKKIIFTYNHPYANDENQVDVLKNLLDQLAGENGHKFDVYPMTRLFYVMRKELAARGKVDEIPNENFSNDFLSRDSYELTEGFSCRYHEENEATSHCALSRVHRLAFLLAGYFCAPLGIQLVPGRHFPKDAKVSHATWSFDSDSSMHEQRTDHNMPIIDEKPEIDEKSEIDEKPEVVSENRVSSVSTSSFDEESLVIPPPAKRLAY